MSKSFQFRSPRHSSGKVKGYVIVESSPSTRSKHIRREAASTSTGMSSRYLHRDRDPTIGISKRDRYPGHHRRSNDDYYDEYEVDSYSYTPARLPRSARDGEIKPVIMERSSLPVDHDYFDDEREQRLRPRERNLQLHRKATNNGIPFGRAMTKLHKQLERAYRFYEDFKSQFENEISLIKVYAEDHILEDLWVMKVRGRSLPVMRGNRGFSDFRGDSDEDDPALERPGLRFAVMRKKVIEALGTALHSDVNASTGSLQSKKAAGRHDSIERLHGKVATANEQIRSLLSAAADTSENCDGLLNELQMLKDLVDPDSVKNRALYRDFDDEEDEGDEREDDVY